jgi:sulfite exporter TauE/SafE
MTAADYISVLLIALAGSGHCAGMCGVFSVAVSANARNTPALLARQFAYHLGKATAYLFIAALLLLAGSLLSAQQTLVGAQNILGYIAGALMILAGLAYALELRLPVAFARWWQGSAACGAMRALWQSPSLIKSVLIGWINGFLPCGLSFTALIYIASFGSVTGVIAGSYLFGLGTLPALLAVAWLGRRAALGLQTRRWLVRASGALLVIFGIVTLLRGTPAIHAWLHGGHDHTHMHGSPTQEICR